MRTYLTLLLTIVTTTAHAQPPSFEVASIKPNQSGSHTTSAGTDPGGKFAANNASLQALIAYAYGEIGRAHV